jgi:thioredoxin 1
MGKAVAVTDADFATAVEGHEGLAMVDFWAAWCGPCRMIAPIVEELAGQYEGQVKVTKLDVDANPRAAARFGVRSIPTILFFKGGKVVDQVIGAVPKAALEQKIAQHV